MSNRATGNQYQGRKVDIVRALVSSRRNLECAAIARVHGFRLTYQSAMLGALAALASARAMIDAAPASTRRRWKAGR